MNKTIVKMAACLLAVTLLAVPVMGDASSMVQAPTLLRYRNGDMDTDPVRTTTPSSSSSSSSFTTSTKYGYDALQKKIKEAQETNKDVKGWLTIPNTNINMPITHSSKDNKYYLYRDWKGVNHPGTTYKNYVDTAVYADYRTVYGKTWNGTSKNTVLYGHNWTNLRNPMDIGNVSKHTMFGQLPSYADKDFASEHPYIYYSTGENEGIWKVFSVAYCEIDANFFYNAPNPTEEKYKKLHSEWKARTMYDFDVDVNTTDHILTLSTCTRTYGQHANQRFVVVARLLRDGESEKDAVAVTVNADMKKPKL